VFSQLKSYISFYIASGNQHGIHSPFVFNLVTKCFSDKKKDLSNPYHQIQRYKHTLLKDHKSIIVTDFGAGSRVFKSNKREISAIAKNAGISKKRAELLIRVVQYFKPAHILEIGTSLGIGTACFSLGNPNCEITTLEGCPNTAKIAIEQFEKFNLNNIEVVIGNFKTTLPKILLNKKYDLIYFDGNHQKEATIDYFEQCLYTISNNSIFIFDDIHWSKGMENAWNYIKDHKKVTISIDTFQWGFVFFRKEQPKEHFIIRV
jgi:predicted O-methyltransferase YrrM